MVDSEGSGSPGRNTAIEKRARYKDAKKNSQNPSTTKSTGTKVNKGFREELKKNKDGGKGKGKEKVKEWNEEELVGHLLDLDSDRFANLTTNSEYDEADEYEEYPESDYSDFDYLGLEDEDVYQRAIDRASKNIFPEGDEDLGIGRDLENNMFLDRGQPINHPVAPVLQAMGLPDKVFSTSSPSFAKIDIKLTTGQGLSGPLRQIWASPSPRHLLTNWDERKPLVDMFPIHMYAAWRLGSIPSAASGLHRLSAIPSQPAAPLEYITIQEIKDAESMTILTRAAELPGRRLTNYRDPMQKENRHAYLFDPKVLSQYQKDSPEGKTIAALLGSQQILSVNRMLKTFPNGLSKAEISSIFLWIDFNNEGSSAMILIELSHKASEAPSTPLRLLGNFKFDSQPPGVDPRLIVTSLRKDPIYHPIEGLITENEPSYFEIKAQYMLESDQSLNFHFYYSRIQNHFIIDDLGQLGETLEESDARKVGSILYSAWIHEAGLKPISSVTLLDLSDTVRSLIENTAGTLGGLILDSRANPEELSVVLQKLGDSQSREAKILQALLGLSGEAFGPFSVAQLAIGIDEEKRALLSLSVNYDQNFQSDSQGIFGDADNFLLMALRRGTRMKSEMEILEPTFLDDELGINLELEDLKLEDQSVYLDGDRGVSFTQKVFSKYKSVPRKPLDCKSQKRPPLFRELESWGQKLKDPKDPESTSYDNLQKEIGQGIAAAFSNRNQFCTFTLMLKRNGDRMQDEWAPLYEDKDAFQFGILNEPGIVVLRSKFSRETDLVDVGDAIWGLWMMVDTATKIHPNEFEKNVKDGKIGLRFVTILQPSDETTESLRKIYRDGRLNMEEVIVFPNQGTALILPPDITTTSENIARRVLLAINGLPEVYAIEDLCRRKFSHPYSILNYRTRVNAVLVKWDGNIPQLVIVLGHFTFKNSRNFEGLTESAFKVVTSLRQRKDLLELTKSGCEIAWSSISSYMFNVLDYTPDGTPPDADSHDPQKHRSLEYSVANIGSFLSCPNDIREFLHKIPWQPSAPESNGASKEITQQEVADLQRLVTEEVTVEDQQAYLKGEIGPKLYKSYQYTRQYHPARYIFHVRGSPYHLIVIVVNDGQSGSSVEAGLPQSTRIERLSRAYYDLFVRTV
ncbi:hypothetical protein TWF718_001517 [Orbilia javanica]|uniref:Uncharacterized protein n=1 Tax=Orbilia javanica TaxID=47235 RepID=A0AAN8RNC9_9PEZI